jgi:TRAP-type mannitol/chloroaromatic compound transport system permease small subunit
LSETEINVNNQPERGFNRWLKAVTKFFCYISAFMVIIMSLVTTYGVLRRYLFNSPDNNAYLTICIVTLFFAVFSWAEIQRQKKHIVVDYFSHRFSRKIRDILEYVVAPVLGLLFCGVLTWKNWSSAVFSFEISEHTTTAIALPVYPLKLVITFGCIMICLVLLTQMINYFVALGSKKASNN